MTDRLRPLWDFNDLELSETRFTQQLELEETPAGKAEVLTQLARVQGLRDRFEDAQRLLDDAERLGGAEAWVLLERGRVFRSAGEAATAHPLFERAFDVAHAEGDDFVAGDAAHMAALTGDMEGWTQRGLELASSSETAAHWTGPLLNNLGWARYEAGDFDGALAAFTAALEAHERNGTRPYARESARYAVGKCLRALRRPADAAAALELAVAWASSAGVDDAWFHEELAEDYAALGRDADAAEQARRALALLADAQDAGRLARLRELAAA